MCYHLYNAIEVHWDEHWLSKSEDEVRILAFAQNIYVVDSVSVVHFGLLSLLPNINPPEVFSMVSGGFLYDNLF